MPNPLTVQEAADRFDPPVTERRVRQICEAGELGRYDAFARRWVIDRAELKAFLKIPRPVGRPKHE